MLQAAEEAPATLGSACLGGPTHTCPDTLNATPRQTDPRVASPQQPAAPAVAVPGSAAPVMSAWAWQQWQPWQMTACGSAIRCACFFSGSLSSLLSPRVWPFALHFHFGRGTGTNTPIQYHTGAHAISRSLFIMSLWVLPTARDTCHDLHFFTPFHTLRALPGVAWLHLTICPFLFPLTSSRFHISRQCAIPPPSLHPIHPPHGPSPQCHPAFPSPSTAIDRVQPCPPFRRVHPIRPIHVQCPTSMQCVPVPCHPIRPWPMAHGPCFARLFVFPHPATSTSASCLPFPSLAFPSPCPCPCPSPSPFPSLPSPPGV